jgi:hypothetical protein
MPDSSPVLLDTSGWIAILNADDRLHPPAARLLAEFARNRRRLVTTDWVLAETGNGLARVAARARLAQAITTFLEADTCRLVRVDETLFNRALELYAQATDKTWGLIDCASFIVAREAGITDVLTADRHFEQAGFRCLLPTASSSS